MHPTYTVVSCSRSVKAHYLINLPSLCLCSLIVFATTHLKVPFPVGTCACEPQILTKSHLQTHLYYRYSEDQHSPVGPSSSLIKKENI